MMFETVKSDSLTVYPQNSQFALHWREFLGGYRSTESVETKFPFSDSSRALRVNSIGFVDGQTKVLIMVSILAMCHELDTWLDMKIYLDSNLVTLSIVSKTLPHPATFHQSARLDCFRNGLMNSSVILQWCTC